MSSSRFTTFLVAFFVLVLTLALAACSSGVRRRPGTDPDGGTMSMIDSGRPPTDGGVMPGFDSGVLPGFDGGRPGFDGGRPGFDGGRPGFDGGRPGFDGGRPGVDGGGFPIGDAALPFCTMPTDCPPGQMCCEILPGTGIGTCATVCTGGFP